MRNFIYPVAVPFLRLYWRWVKPKTFGVKVIIKHPKSNQILLVQHSYGDTNIWHLPGGGYNPNRESAKDAAHREVFEELGVGLVELTHLAEYKTSAEGKRDTVTIFTARAQSSNLILNNEIKDCEWVRLQAFDEYKTYKITKDTLASFIETSFHQN